MRKARPRQTALLPDLWPPADREAWKVATAKGSVLRGGGLASHLASRTIEDLTRRYAYFLGFLHRIGDLAKDDLPGTSVTVENMEAYIAELQGYASSVTVAGSLRKILRVASCIAPERDWEWLRKRCKRLEAAARPANKRPRVVEVDRLSELGHRLMDEAERSRDRPPFTRALLYRDALAIGLLAASLLRLGNLASLKPGKTLKIVLPNKLGNGHITLDAKGAATVVLVPPRPRNPKDRASIKTRLFPIVMLSKKFKIYTLPEFQPIYDFENDHFSFWAGPEFGKMMEGGNIVYLKPGFGVSPDEAEGDRDWSFEFGWRKFLN